MATLMGWVGRAVCGHGLDWKGFSWAGKSFVLTPQPAKGIESCSKNLSKHRVFSLPREICDSAICLAKDRGGPAGVKIPLQQFATVVTRSAEGGLGSCAFGPRAWGGRYYNHGLTIF